MALLQEQERISKQLGNVESLTTSMANQASLLTRQRQRQQARAKAEEALALAQKHGLAALAKQIAGLPILRQ